MNEKRSFFDVIKGMFVGIVDPAEYIENGKKGSWGSAILLAIIFSILTPLLTFFLPVSSVIGGGRLARELDRELPDFSLSGDEFYCEGNYVWDDAENGSVYLEIDTDNTYIDEDILEDILQKTDYQTVIIVYSREVLLYSDGQSDVVTWRDLYDAFDESSYDLEEILDKQTLIDFIEDSLMPMVRAIYLVLVVAAFLGFLLCGLLWGLIGSLAASSNRAKISFGELVKASIYIRVIWSTIRKLIKVYIFGGSSMLIWTFGFVIILVYMLVAVSKYAKRQPADIYGGGAQAGLNSNMYYGQSMNHAAGQYNPMGMNMNQGMNPMNMNPNAYQNNPNMNPNMYQNNPNMNPNMYQNNPNMDPNAYQNNNYQNDSYQENNYSNNNSQEANPYSEGQNSDQ